MLQLLPIAQIQQVVDIENILVPGGECTEFQNGTEFLRQHLLFGVNEQTGTDIINTNIKTEIFLFNVKVFMYTQVDLAGEQGSFRILDCNMDAFPVIILLVQFLYRAGHLDGNHAHRVQLMNKGTDCFVL